MNQKTMLNVVNGIDEDLIDQYFEIGEEAKKKKARGSKRNLIKWGAVAACFVLILSICILPMFDSSDSSGYQPILALTVYAVDGTPQGMELDQSFLNSGISGGTIFGKDVPTFEFYVAPIEQGEEGDIFEKYDIEISYNGKIVGGKDEHIRLTFVVPVHGVEGDGVYGVGRYCIIGWFDEATDVFVTLKDKNSGEVIEKMTVNVSYSEADKAYKLTMTDFYSIADAE